MTAPALVSRRPVVPAVSSGISDSPHCARSGVPPPSLLARALPAFSGTAGLVVKLVLLVDRERDRALGGRSRCSATSSWFVAALCVVAATLAIDAVYLLPIRGLIPLKFLVPGTVFLVGFQLIPIVYNGSVAFSNWSTGHNLTKEEAIRTIQETSLAQPRGRLLLRDDARPARDGKLALLLVEEGTGKAFAGTEDGLEALEPADLTVANGTITAARGLRGVDRYRPRRDRRGARCARDPCGRRVVRPR